MKALCSICNKEGILEVRGNSKRIIHYSYVNGKRTFSRHKLVGTIGYSNENNGYSMGTENLEISPDYTTDISLPRVVSVAG